MWLDWHWAVESDDLIVSNWTVRGTHTGLGLHEHFPSSQKPGATLTDRGAVGEPGRESVRRGSGQGSVGV